MNRLFLSLPWIVLLAAGGCGRSDLVPASGTVTQGKTPVADASVLFHYPDGNFAVGTTDAQGKYTLTFGNRTGARPGEKIGVTVTKWATTRQGITSPSPLLPSSGPPSLDVKLPTPMGMGVQTPTNLLPPEFGDPKNPKLTLDVPARGSDKLNIALP